MISTRIRFFIFFYFTCHLIFSQENKSILTDIDIQIESTAAINKMYNFEFNTSLKEFRWLEQEYKNHPLPIFLKGLSLWWKIDAYSGISDLLKIDSLKKIDSEFLEIMDNTISVSKEIYENNKIDAAFFLSAAHAFKGRLLADRKKWRSASVAGINALKYLKEIKQDTLMIPEISFGNGLFNYYSIWISDRYPLLKPFISLFPEGNKNLGIEQLVNAANTSFYTRTEAQLFLVKIFSAENQLNKALYLSKYLFETFPNNSIFHKYYTQLLYRTSNFKLCEKESLKILENFSLKKIGYFDNEARLAHFFLGEIYSLSRNYRLSIYHLKKSLEFSDKFKNKKLGYTIYSNFLIGKIYYTLGEKNLSKKYLKSVIRSTNRNDDLNKKSRDYLK